MIRKVSKDKEVKKRRELVIEADQKYALFQAAILSVIVGSSS